MNFLIACGLSLMAVTSANPMYGNACSKYTVVSGDTAIGISNTYGITMSSLMANNPLVTDWNSLAVGECLKLCPSAPTVSCSANQVMQDGICYKAIDNCGSYSSNGCSVCATGYNAMNGNCYLNCPANQILQNGICVDSVSNCYTYNKDGTCSSCAQGYNGPSCLPVKMPAFCAAADLSANAPNAVTGLYSCQSCQTGYLLVQDSQNNNYKLCVPHSYAIDSTFSPLFAIVDGQYKCVEIHNEVVSSGRNWHGLKAVPCERAQFKNVNVFTGNTMPYCKRDTEAHVATFYTNLHDRQEVTILYLPNYVGRKGLFEVDYGHHDQLQDRNFVFQNGNLVLKPTNSVDAFNFNSCATVTSDGFLVINPSVYSCSTMGYLTLA